MDIAQQFEVYKTKRLSKGVNENKVNLFVAYVAYNDGNTKRFMLKRFEKVGTESGDIPIYEKEAEFLRIASNCHSNVVEFVCSQRENDDYLIFMEYCSRGNLSQELKRRKAYNNHYSITELLNNFKILAECLSTLHNYTDSKISNGIAHRDIKPDNIFINAK